MSIERTASANQSLTLLSLINRADTALNRTQAQVASGKLSGDYTGLGDKAALLEAARTSAARAEGYQANTTLALDQADLQDSQLSSLSDLANQLRHALTQAIADGDGSNLITEAQSVFDQAAQILNARDANGNYLYGGDKDNAAPLNVTSLAQLAALPSVARAFSDGTLKKSVAIGDGQTVQLGVLASDAGTALLQTLKDIANFDAGPNGNFAASTTLSGPQNDFLTAELPSVISAAQAINTQAAGNGFVFQQLKDASDHQQSLATLYKGFVSNLEDVDLPGAITQFYQNRLALQAALQVTSQLGQVSLLNYLGGGR
jgi:flagellar hook-associated protein 3 FlgL